MYPPPPQVRVNGVLQPTPRVTINLRRPASTVPQEQQQRPPTAHQEQQQQRPPTAPQEQQQQQRPPTAPPPDTPMQAPPPTPYNTPSSEERRGVRRPRDESPLNERNLRARLEEAVERSLNRVDPRVMPLIGIGICRRMGQSFIRELEARQARDLAAQGVVPPPYTPRSPTTAPPARPPVRPEAPPTATPPARPPPPPTPLPTVTPPSRRPPPPRPAAPPRTRRRVVTTNRSFSMTSGGSYSVLRGTESDNQAYSPTDPPMEMPTNPPMEMPIDPPPLTFRPFDDRLLPSAPPLSPQWSGDMDQDPLMEERIVIDPEYGLPPLSSTPPPPPCENGTSVCVPNWAEEVRQQIPIIRNCNLCGVACRHHAVSFPAAAAVSGCTKEVDTTPGVPCAGFRGPRHPDADARHHSLRRRLPPRKPGMLMRRSFLHRKPPGWGTE